MPTDTFPSQAVKARPLRLDAGMSIEQGLRAIVAQCLAQMHANEAGVMRGTDPECIHQMRVGMRRLRSALHLFGHSVSLPPALQNELAWLGAALGAARDADVLAGSSLAPLASAHPQQAGLPPLLRFAATNAQWERQRAAAAVGSARGARLMQALGAWVQAPTDTDARQALAGPLAPRAARTVGRLHRRLVRSGKRLKKGTPAQRHRARIAAKKARYAVEFFQALRPAPAVARYVKGLAALQDALGALNDASVADHLLCDLAEQRPELAEGAAFARAQLADDAQRNVRRLARLWHRVKHLAPP